MVILKVNGRLGNQLFIYAYGQALKKQWNQEVAYDFYGFKGNGVAETVRAVLRFTLRTPRYANDALSELAISYERCHPVRHAASLQRARIIREDSLPEFGCEKVYPKHAYLVGYWQNEHWFQNSKTELQETIVFRRKHTHAVAKLISQIENSESVCVHVRRGDYVENPATAKVHNLCGWDYYKTAVQLLQAHTGGGNHYYVFSDDIAWCKNNLTLLATSITFVELPGSYTNLDFELMMHCKHFIIANSSYSWWAAWLGKSPHKMVICPARWTNYKDSPLTPQCADWIKV